jgi:release factor glutamine methyltransferase
VLNLYNVSGHDLWQWWMQAKQGAIAAAVPLVELDWLMQELCGLDRLTLRLETFRHRAHIPLAYSLDDLDRLWASRLRDRTPVQYLAGRVTWRGQALRVSPAVLIPRPETEELIDHVLAAIAVKPGLAYGPWADLGTGSGAIALGLATVLPQATIYAVDTSLAALAIAQGNGQAQGLADRIHYCHGSWFAALPPEALPLSGMVSNPPYIPTDTIPTLQPEVRHHEPHLALDGGPDGLDSLRHLVTTAPTYLKPGGLWLVELMDGQGSAVIDLLERNGHYSNITLYPDLAGRERAVLAYRTGGSPADPVDQMPIE